MKTAILGGTFDPVSPAHLDIIKTLAKRFDRVIVVPTTIRYYKKEEDGYENECMFSFNQRCKKIQECLDDISEHEGIQNVEISRVERDAPGNWRFIDTLEAICNDRNEYTIAMGADSFQKFKTWAKWEQIIEKADILVFGRPGYGADKFPDIPHEFIAMNNPVSSTELRKKIMEYIDEEMFEEYLSDCGWRYDQDGNDINFDEPYDEDLI